jgi:hypothetical protein
LRREACCCTTLPHRCERENDTFLMACQYQPLFNAYSLFNVFTSLLSIVLHCGVAAATVSAVAAATCGATLPLAGAGRPCTKAASPQ